MEIVWLKVEELKPYKDNAKIHTEQQVANVAESIRQIGWRQPIVVDGEKTVVVGHCRLMAAKRLGESEVPCIVADDLTENQLKAYRIIDNKCNESEWDEATLIEELAEVDLSGFDFEWPDEEEKPEAEPIELEDESGENEGKECKCPKCGFVFWEAKK